MSSEKENQKSEKKDYRKIWYKFLIYPESAKENWIEYIKERVAVYVISPLHDQDIKEDEKKNKLVDENGNYIYKKAHYHVLIKFSSKKSLEQVIEEFEPIGAVIDKTKVETPPPFNNKSLVTDPGHWVRYWIHKENPEKHQYNIEDIQHTPSFDISKYFAGEKENDEATTIAEMFNYIKFNKVRKYSDFLDKIMTENFDWFKICVTSRVGQVISEYLKSKYPPSYFNKRMRE